MSGYVKKILEAIGDPDGKTYSVDKDVFGGWYIMHKASGHMYDTAHSDAEYVAEKLKSGWMKGDFEEEMAEYAPKNVVVSSTVKDGYTLNEYSDGTWGYKTVGGQEQTGYKNKGAASSAGNTKAKAEADKVVESIDKGGYKLQHYGNDTWGYELSDGTVKKGYKNKGAASSAGNTKAMKIESEKVKAETEAAVKQYSSRIDRMYSDAVDEMKSKLAGFMEEYERENAEKLADLASNKISQEQYDDWLKGKATQRQWYQSMADTLAQDLVNADKVAASWVNDMLPGVYANHFNFATYQIEGTGGVSLMFDMYDKDTVRKLIKDKPDLLPEMVVKDSADLGWHKRKVMSAITQGILQGESVDKIADRLGTVAGMDYRAAMRSARTMCTAAENLGRMDSYHRAQEMGVKMQKEWMSTLDTRTRDSHRLLDGEKVGVDDEFSNGCKFPGDPDAKAGEVYNCRCTLIAAIDGLDYENVTRNSKLGTMTYDEWKEQALQKQPQYKYEKAKKEYEDALAAFNAKYVAPDKKYEGIWNDPVTVEDYEDKKDKIQSKLDYFESQLKNAKDMGLDVPDVWGDPPLTEHWQKMIDLTKEFDEAGKKYVSMVSSGAMEADKKALDKLKSEMVKWKDKAGAKKASMFGEAYSKERKDAAMFAISSKEADDVLREPFGAIWRESSVAERKAIYGYTKSYSKFNEPLRGWEYGKTNYSTGAGWMGVGNTDLNAGRANNGKMLNAMTDLIERCSYEHDMWAVRGCEYGGMDSFFDVSMDLLRHGSDEQLEEELLGKVVPEYGFMSCGTAKGTGFHRDVSMNIYLPSGTKYAYAEPFSAYSGESTDWRWDGVKKQRRFGTESEIIIQQGTQFRVIGVRREGYGLHVDIEAVGREEPQRWQG